MAQPQPQPQNNIASAVDKYKQYSNNLKTSFTFSEAFLTGIETICDGANPAIAADAEKKRIKQCFDDALKDERLNEVILNGIHGNLSHDDILTNYKNELCSIIRSKALVQPFPRSIKDNVINAVDNLAIADVQIAQNTAKKDQFRDNVASINEGISQFMASISNLKTNVPSKGNDAYLKQISSCHDDLTYIVDVLLPKDQIEANNAVRHSLDIFASVNDIHIEPELDVPNTLKYLERDYAKQKYGKKTEILIDSAEINVPSNDYNAELAINQVSSANNLYKTLKESDPQKDLDSKKKLFVGAAAILAIVIILGITLMVLGFNGVTMAPAVVAALSTTGAAAVIGSVAAVESAYNSMSEAEKKITDLEKPLDTAIRSISAPAEVANKVIENTKNIAEDAIGNLRKASKHTTDLAQKQLQQRASDQTTGLMSGFTNKTVVKAPNNSLGSLNGVKLVN